MKEESLENVHLKKSDLEDDFVNGHHSVILDSLIDILPKTKYLFYVLTFSQTMHY